MQETKYLIVGSSHAGLAALDAIRLADREGTVAMVAKDDSLPYSPTVLPYVFSGAADPDRVFLRDDAFFEKNKVEFIRGVSVVSLDGKAGKAVLSDDREIAFEKALIATGASPQTPDIEGLSEAPYRVLRTLTDAVGLKESAAGNGSAVILGAGLIGLHAAENLAMAGMRVTVVEMLNQVLPGYFDKRASGLIKKAFTEQGVNIMLGSPVTHVAANHNGCVVSLENGLDISADVLLAAAGVTPNWECVMGQGVETDRGILVDDYMRTSLANVWAAGDVVQAKGFFDGKPVVSATLPMAVEQGRIAGADMAGDSAVGPFAGSLPLNTYSFFGNRAFSVGQAVPSGSARGFEVDYEYSPTSQRYKKLVFKGARLVGAMSVNSDLDPGVLAQMIRRRVDLDGKKKLFAGDPKETSRLLMTKLWR